MTPDPRTEEIRTTVQSAIRDQMHNMQIDVQSVLYLLGRIEALENVAEAARVLRREIHRAGRGLGYGIHDAASNLAAALDALGGAE